MKKERIELNFLGAGFGGAGFDSGICPGIDSCLNPRLNSCLASGGAESRTFGTLITSLIIIIAITSISAITAMTALKEAMAISLFQALEK